MRCQTIIVALLLLGASRAGAASIDDLYRAQTIVTGQGEANRLAGFAPCLEDVLVKVSGDPRLIGDARLAAIERNAADLVASFRYHDRMSGIPFHDEQGSRDRPYDLIVRFDRDKVDAALRALGAVPWTADRPRVAVLVAMRPAAAEYVLASDARHGAGERESLAAAADKRGIPIVLPTQADLAGLGIADDKIPDDAATLEAAGRRLGVEVALSGALTWVEKELGWSADWLLAAPGGPHRWRVRGVSFDEAFRNAMGGTAQILSGHGDPAAPAESSK